MSSGSLKIRRKKAPSCDLAEACAQSVEPLAKSRARETIRRRRARCYISRMSKYLHRCAVPLLPCFFIASLAGCTAATEASEANGLEPHATPEEGSVPAKGTTPRPTIPKQDAPAKPTKPTEAPAVEVRSGSVVFAAPAILSDEASIFRLADGHVVLRFFSNPPTPRLGKPPRWSVADETAAREAAEALGRLTAGTYLALPASRLPRRDLPRSFVADLPRGSCSTDCPFDASTNTYHEAVGNLPKFDGQDRLYMGPNVAGGLISITSVTVLPGEYPAVDIVGTTAGLGDVFDKLSAPSSVAENADADGFARLFEGFEYDFSGKTLYSAGPLTVKVKKGLFAATPSVRTSLDLSGGSVKKAELALKGEFDLDAEFEVSASGRITKDFSSTLFEAEAPLPPMLVGGVPVTETVKLTVTADCHVDAAGVAKVSAGASLHQDMSLGGRFEDDAFHADFGVPPPSLAPIGPTASIAAGAKAGCSVRGHFSVLFYGVIGPYVSVSTGATFETNTIPEKPTSLAWSLEGSLASKIGVEGSLRVPGLGPLNTLISARMPTLETELFSKKYPLASGIF